MASYRTSMIERILDNRDYFGESDTTEPIPKTNKVDEYLSKMGSSKYDIEEIFVEVKDLGYELNFNTNEFDNGSISKLSISIDNEDVHEDISFLQSVYHAISRFMSTYKDKTMKINYEIGCEITINCYL